VEHQVKMCPPTDGKIEAEGNVIDAERIGRDVRRERVSRRERGWRCSCLPATPYRDAIGTGDEDEGHDWWARVWRRRSERLV